MNDFDEKMKNWQKIRKKRSLLKIINNKEFLYYWTWKFDSQYKNKSKHWDERWLYSNWKNSKLSIIPKKNLVKNIGFGATATHTKTEQWYSNLETQEIEYKWCAIYIRMDNNCYIFITNHLNQFFSNHQTNFLNHTQNDIYFVLDREV